MDAGPWRYTDEFKTQGDCKSILLLDSIIPLLGILDTSAYEQMPYVQSFPAALFTIAKEETQLTSFNRSL